MTHTGPAGGSAGDSALPPVRVVHLLWRLSQGGGVQTVVRTLIDGVDPSRVELSVVTARPRLEADRLDALRAEVVALGHAGSRLRPWPRVRLALAVVRAVRRLRPDVVQLHSGTLWMGMLVPIGVRRVGLLVEVHDAPGSGRHGPWTDRIEGLWVRLTRATIVCHSSPVAHETSRRWHVPVPRVRNFPLAVDTDRFTPSPSRRSTTRAEHGLTPETFVVVVVGRLVASKRVDRVVRAVAEVERSVLLVVGAGPAADDTNRLASDLGVSARVRLLGSVDADTLVDVVGAADVLVSASEYEGFGLTLVEAMAAGVPVVATAVGGVVDVVDDGVTGVLVPYGDDAALAGALGALAADPPRRAAMGEAGRRRAVERFGVRSLVASFSEVYEAVARERRRR